MSKKQKGLSNFTTPKFHLTNRQNAVKKFVRCTLKIVRWGKVGNLEVFGRFLRIPKRDEPVFRRGCGALREESITDVKSICCNGFTDLRGDQRVGYEYSRFCEIMRK
jgi:hypothetical protein